MVRFIREFIVKGKDEDIFEAVRDRLPYSLRWKGGYQIDSEIREGDRLYRKANIHKDVTKLIPAVLYEQIPATLVDIVSNVTEEKIFYPKQLKIQLSVSPRSDPIYTLSGSIRFIALNPETCKVVILLYLEWKGLEKHISSTTARDMLLPLLENKFPDIFVRELQEFYQDILVKTES